jgi:hypothetical protein
MSYEYVAIRVKKKKSRVKKKNPREIFHVVNLITNKG